MADVRRLEVDCRMGDTSLSEEVVESNLRLRLYFKLESRTDNRVRRKRELSMGKGMTFSIE